MPRNLRPIRKLRPRKLTSKMRIKSIDPLQMAGKKSTASLTVGGDVRPSAYVSSCLSSVLAACSSLRYRLFYLILDNASLYSKCSRNVIGNKHTLL